MEDWLNKQLVDEDATIASGRQLGDKLKAFSGATVFLRGHLGAGKTTFTRGVLSAFGHHSAVKSPTYTLVEPYDFPEGSVYHFDLYRLGEPEELEYMGIRDYFNPNSWCLIEWDERGEGILPAPDLIVNLSKSGTGRILNIELLSEKAKSKLGAL